MEKESGNGAVLVWVPDAGVLCPGVMTLDYGSESPKPVVAVSILKQHRSYLRVEILIGGKPYLGAPYMFLKNEWVAFWPVQTNGNGSK